MARTTAHTEAKVQLEPELLFSNVCFQNGCIYHSMGHASTASQRGSTRMKDGTNTAEGPNMGRLVRAGSKVPLEERNMNSLGFHNKPHPWWSWYLQTGEQLPFTTES